jgi:hypothetical protein
LRKPQDGYEGNKDVLEENFGVKKGNVSGLALGMSGDRIPYLL